MQWIGLTGGIATGKSTVSRLIESRGYAVIDADEISHRITQIGQPGYDRIVSHFGVEILNDHLLIDRKQLGEIVFNDAGQKKMLESFLHPLIKAETQRRKGELELTGKPFAFYDVPLLYENKIEKDFDQVVVVWCDPAVQLARLKKRNLLSEKDAQLRIAAQLPLLEKVSRAHHCIDNSSGETALIFLVDSFLEKLAKNPV